MSKLQLFYDRVMMNGLLILTEKAKETCKDLL